MILKSYIVEQNIRVLKDYQSTLIYGENNGIKDDIKETIKKEEKDSEIITFFEKEVSGCLNRIIADSTLLVPRTK